MNVDPDGRSAARDYELKLNSYDLGVDIELADAIQRLRFEHPEVRVRRADRRARPHLLRGGANIVMLRTSAHAFKVNFCKYTNETRLGIEDASANSGIKRFLAALNGTAPAAATSWPSRATRSCWSTTATAPCRFPRCRCSACCRAPAG